MAIIKTKFTYNFGSTPKEIAEALALFVLDVREDIAQLQNTLFTTLPTAEKDKRGSFSIVEASSTEDLLKICIKDAAGAFLYKQISLNINTKGADVASATTTTLGNDGDTFDITGTTSITSVTIKPVGTVVKLQFDGILTFTDGSNLKLAGNFVTTAGDTIMLYSDGTNWIELARSVN